MREGDVALVRQSAGFKNEVYGDLLNEDSLSRACRGIHTVIHCAGHAHAFSNSKAQAHHAINFLGTNALVRAAAQNGVKKFIFLSSVKAQANPGDRCVDEEWEGEPHSAYGQAKRAAELSVLAMGAKAGMHVVVLRLAMVYGRGGRGNLDRLARAIASGWFPGLPETGNRRSLVHVRDVVSAVNTVVNCSEASGKVYIVAHPRAYSTAELCDAIRALQNLPKPYWRIPAWGLRMGGKLGDLGREIFSASMPVNSELISRLLDSECYSPARIKHDLGWEASVDLAAGLTEMLSPPDGIELVLLWLMCDESKSGSHFGGNYCPTRATDHSDGRCGGRP
jgi:nucleoside-diphosphate-sugar epimerase